MHHGSHYLHEGHQGRAEVEPSQQQPPPPPPPPQTPHLLFFSFSLMTMTRSPLDLLRGGLMLTSCSSPARTESGSGLIREPSWSSSDGCSSPGHMVGQGITFTAMKRAEQSAFRSWLCCLKLHLRVRERLSKPKLLPPSSSQAKIKYNFPQTRRVCLTHSDDLTYPSYLGPKSWHLCDRQF